MGDSKFFKEKHICIVATSGISLTNFRGPLIRKWIENGNKVTCISNESYEEMQYISKELGADYYQVPGSRTGMGIFEGIKMIQNYQIAFEKLKPDICYLYMSKPIAFGGIAANKCKIPHINVLVNGLENAYYRTGVKDFIVRFVMSTLTWNAGRHADNVFFQNSQDMKYFKDRHLMNKKNECLVYGSGVDMKHYMKVPLPDKPAAVMISRLLWSKGIREYLDAAKIVKQKYPEFKMMLVGGLDENHEAISKEDLEKYVKTGYIDYCGKSNDVRQIIKQASIFVLPSYHEGLPRSVLEAMSMGRAIVTTDAPGCRDTVIEGENGFVVPVKNSEMIAEKIIYLIEHQDVLKQMSERSYEICKEKFEVDKVNDFINNKIGEKL